MLENGRVLINEYSESKRHLVEIDPIKGTFESKTSVEQGFITQLRKRDDGKILVTNYDRASLTWSMGIYNEDTHTVDYFSTIDVHVINDPTNLRFIYAGDDFIYTHNPNIYYLSTEEVYLAKWDFHGSRIWRKIIDPTKEAKIARIESVRNDHVLFKTISPNELWQVAKISDEGTLLWHKKMNEHGEVFRVHENDLGDIFVLNTKAVTKHDSEGNQLWSNPLSDFPNGFIWSYGFPTTDGGIVFEFEAGKDMILTKINAHGNIAWKEKYWEPSNGSGGIGFLELPGGDLIVTSLSGFATKYKLN